MSRDSSIRWVTARELARDSSRVLDEIQTSGTKMMVCRHGLPVALISPVGRAAERAEVAALLETADSGRRPASVAEEADPESLVREAETLLGEADLRETERQVLLVADDSPTSTDAFLRVLGAGVSEVAVALTRLEVKGFLRMRSGLYTLTPDGARVRAALQQVGHPRGNGHGWARSGAS